MTTENEPQKQCSKCKEFKPLSKFYVKSGRGDGRQSHCAACANKSRAERDKRDRENPERIRNEATKYASYPRCRSCHIVMFPNGDVDNRPWDGDSGKCESCGRKGLLGRKVTAKV